MLLSTSVFSNQSLQTKVQGKARPSYCMIVPTHDLNTFVLCKFQYNSSQLSGEMFFIVTTISDLDYHRVVY